MLKKKYFGVFLLYLLFILAISVNQVVGETASPVASVVYDPIQSAKYGIDEVVMHQITLTNNYPVEKSFTIHRMIHHNEEIASHPGWTTESMKLEHREKPYLVYEATIAPFTSENVLLSVKYKQLPLLQEIPETVIFHQNHIKPIRTSPFSIRCKIDDVCNKDKGENYKNCPQDCPSGESDHYCDRRIDSICDPDCIGTIDKDCKKGQLRSITPLTPITESPELTNEEIMDITNKEIREINHIGNILRHRTYANPGNPWELNTAYFEEGKPQTP